MSATVRVLERVVLARGRWSRLDLAVRYGLWQRDGQAPILIDTGYGVRSCTDRERSLRLKLYGAALRPRLCRENLMPARLAALGVAPQDIGLTILTHFHPDHIDGLKDLTGARFLVAGRDWLELQRAGALARLRHVLFEELIPADFSSRLTFIEDLPRVSLPYGLGTGGDVFGDGTLLTVPLPGHSLGHFGLLWPTLEPPLLYAADVQWLWRAIAEDRAPVAARLLSPDRRLAVATEALLRAFARCGGEVVLCHDPAARPSWPAEAGA